MPVTATFPTVEDGVIIDGAVPITSEILRVFNNNVVLARRTGSNAGTPAGEDTEDVIVTGRGIGFQAVGTDKAR